MFLVYQNPTKLNALNLSKRNYTKLSFLEIIKNNRMVNIVFLDALYCGKIQNRDCEGMRMKIKDFTIELIKNIKSFLLNEKNMTYEEKNEYAANKYLSQSLMIIDLIILVCYLLVAFTDLFSFPDGAKEVYIVLFPIIIVIVLLPCIWAYVKGVKSKYFKYFVLGLLLFVIAFAGIIASRFTILLWCLPLIFVMHYYNPKLAKIFYFLALLLLITSMLASLYVGHWDSSYFCNVLEKDDIDTISVRNYLLTSTGNVGWPRIFEIFIFYIIPNVAILYVIYNVCKSLALRTSELTGDVKEAVVTKEKLDSEFSVAKKIQQDSLPKNFPTDNRIELFADMTSAKEVGGDFYDFYYLDLNRILFLVADVSDKGIPAAMFMMQAKTIIDSYTHIESDLDIALNNINKQLCKNNDSLMFVTCWIGVLNMESGELTFVNAGHNYPVLKKSNGETLFVKERPNCFLGIKPNITFDKHIIKLNKNDQLLLYTDGVNECMNSKDEEFGNDRLISTIQNDNSDSCHDVIKHLRNHLGNFANGQDQNDDVTIMCVRYTDIQNPYILTVKSEIEQIDNVLDFINKSLEENGADKKSISEIDVSIDEIFSNIVKFAYSPNIGDVSFYLLFRQNKIIIRITDSGKHFDPLSTDNPKLRDYKETNKIGGLGIYLVKQTMDDVQYSYIDKKNILTIIKTIK